MGTDLKTYNENAIPNQISVLVEPGHCHRCWYCDAVPERGFFRCPVFGNHRTTMDAILGTHITVVGIITLTLTGEEEWKVIDGLIHTIVWKREQDEW